MPVNSDNPFYTFTVELENVTYGFNISYNQRADRWFMDILDNEENVLLAGIPLLTGRDLIGRFKNPSLPPGWLVVMDTTGNDNSPGRNDLGVTCPLLYMESTT